MTTSYPQKGDEDKTNLCSPSCSPDPLYLCGCGCGRPASVGSRFAPGHKPLTTNQQAVLAFLRQHAGTDKPFPSVRTICRGAGVRSTQTVSFALYKLREQGYLEDGPRLRAEFVR